MLKLILRFRCSLCSGVINNVQKLPRNFKHSGFAGINLNDCKPIYSMEQNYYKFKYKAKRKSKEAKVQNVNRENIESVKTILKKHNINTSNRETYSKVCLQSPWVVEQRIMLLQELGANSITLKSIQKFIFLMYLPVSICKATLDIKPDVNLAKNIFSHIDDNSNFTGETLSKLKESIPMRMYYSQCFVEYLKSELNLNKEQVKRISCRKKCAILYNSFRLLNRVLKLLKDLNFTTDFIIKNCWLLSHHPEHLESVLKVMDNNLQDVSERILFKYPKILFRDAKDIELLLKYLKECHVSTKMIGISYQVLKLKPDEFKRRVEVLSKIPFTLIYLRHPSFLLLVKRFQVVLPRTRYLESKNLKYATINALTNYSNYLEQLSTQQKTTKLLLQSFCYSIFGDDAMKLMPQIEAHTCWMFVPLVQMYETFMYLKDLFSLEVIYKHIYAILYNKLDLEAARTILMEQYSDLPPGQFLAMCVYKIEEKCHFSGEAVLTAPQIAELCKEDFYQDKKIKETNLEH